MSEGVRSEEGGREGEREGEGRGRRTRGSAQSIYFERNI